jgi:DNA-3-methyladenine glycosylase II
MTKVPISNISRQKMRRITSEISNLDKHFAKVISDNLLCTIGEKISERNNFQTLVAAVVSQQLATNAARTIHGRLEILAKNEITPKRIFNLSDAALREIGVSGAKSRAIRGLAEAAISGLVPVEDLHELTDTQVFESLTSLWGIGPWTVDMFMISKLNRLDIWPTGDLGVRRGWESIYNLPEQIMPKDLEIKGEKFRPYRSVIAWYCWRHLDTLKVKKS